MKVERVVRRSILDRLLQTGEPEPRTESEAARAFRASVLRDVEWLLNTRSVMRPASEHLTELQDSVYHYGLPDITSKNADSPADRRIVLRKVAECIERFEPRLASVRVVEQAHEEQSRQVRFQVEALLRLPTPEPFFFDTVFDPTNGRFKVPTAV
jgi:type VI secretion system protein ImpF